MKLTEIIQRNRELGAKLGGEEYRLAVISNITVTQLKDILELSLREKGLNATVTIGNYDAIVQDSGRFAGYNAVLVFWEAANLVDGLENKASSMTLTELVALAARVEGEADMMLRNLKSVGLLLLNRFSARVFETDALRPGALSRLCHRLNATLEEKVSANQILVDLDGVLAVVGREAAVDYRQYQAAKALYAVEFFKAYVGAIRPAFMAATGRAKKILALDCDNTLWGGIAGEDGLSGLELGDATPKGKAYREVQTILRGLRHEGVLLALCSKNNLSDVEQIFREHPAMVLRIEDFVAKKVNWADKAASLRELAMELRLGLDSIVFVDDSDFELGLIQKELPEVTCVRVPANRSEYPPVMRQLKSEFFSLARTAEDERKTEMYQQEHRRQEEAARHASIDGYLASLELTVKVEWDLKIPVARAAQLTQKTNQFNLTTRRYTETEVHRMLDDPAFRLGMFSVTDRFGDYGFVGMIVIRRNPASADVAVIDSWLMSCRIIGRNIEHRFFTEVIRLLRDAGVTTVEATYVPTAKNTQVSEFYDGLGFRLVSEDQGRKNYRLNLAAFAPKEIPYIKLL